MKKDLFLYCNQLLDVFDPVSPSFTTSAHIKSVEAICEYLKNFIHH